MSIVEGEEDFTSDDELLEDEVGDGFSEGQTTNTEVLKDWLLTPSNFINPYPKSSEMKKQLCQISGLNNKQLKNWFTNARRRIWKPVLKNILSRIDLKPYLEEVREQINIKKRKATAKDNPHIDKKKLKRSSPSSVVCDPDQMFGVNSFPSLKCAERSQTQTFPHLPQDTNPLETAASIPQPAAQPQSGFKEQKCPEFVTPPLMDRVNVPNLTKLIVPTKVPGFGLSAIARLKSQRKNVLNLFVETKPPTAGPVFSFGISENTGASRPLANPCPSGSANEIKSSGLMQCSNFDKVSVAQNIKVEDSRSYSRSDARQPENTTNAFDSIEEYTFDSQIEKDIMNLPLFDSPLQKPQLQFEWDHSIQPH